MSRAFAEQGPLKLVISSFSPSVGGEGRQHLRVGVENGPPGSERGVKFHFLPPLGVALRFRQTVFSFALGKGPENISDPEEIISGQRKLHIHAAEGVFRSPSAKDFHICREILTKQMMLGLGGCII